MLGGADVLHEGRAKSASHNVGTNFKLSQNPKTHAFTPLCANPCVDMNFDVADTHVAQMSAYYFCPVSVVYSPQL